MSRLCRRRKRRRRRMQPQALLFLLLLQHSKSDSACKNLRCFADYIQILTCMWGTGSTPPRGKLYNLTASWDCGRGGACHFLPTSRNATQYTCFSEQKWCRFGNAFAVKGTVLVDGGVLPVSQECGPFPFHENIKPQSPFNVTAVASPGGYNISWESRYPAYHYLHGELQYQLRFRQMGHTWQGPKHLLQDTLNLWLLPRELQGAAEYELQVRTRPRDQSDYKGVWSDWSPRGSLRTLPRDAGGATWLVTFLVLILVAALITFLGWHRRQWKLENFIPSPAPFFQTLYLVHDGDFKKWAGTSGPGATVLDVHEGGPALPEVLRISPGKALPLSPAAEEAPPARPPALAESRLALLESAAYGPLSLHTVTVADAGGPDSDSDSDASSGQPRALCRREPGPPAWTAEGEAGEGLDLDTLDSGFADSECGSPPGDCALEGASHGRGAAFLPSYVKQWVAAPAAAHPPAPGR